MMNNNLDQLVEQTINLSKNVSLEKYPSKPGLIYFINRKQSFFIIKCQAVVDISNSISSFKEDIVNHDNNPIKFFETEYFELAQVIVDQLGNRRFPCHEDEFYDLKNPDINWWAKKSDTFIEILFFLYDFDQRSELIKLGPIGDPLLAFNRFSEIKKYLIKLFNINDFFCNEKKLLIKTDGQSQQFHSLQGMLLYGQESEEFDQLLKSNLTHTLYYYLKELRALKKFWNEIEQSNFPCS